MGREGCDGLHQRQLGRLQGLVEIKARLHSHECRTYQCRGITSWFRIINCSNSSRIKGAEPCTVRENCGTTTAATHVDGGNVWYETTSYTTKLHTLRSSQYPLGTQYWS